MPRQNRRRAEAPTTAPRGSDERREDYRGTAYAVRTVTGTAAAKTYRCPGCEHEIRAGVPHVVAWPADNLQAADRRHWHSACWSARDRRTPSVQRSRSAPRY